MYWLLFSGADPGFLEIGFICLKDVDVRLADLSHLS